MNVNREVDVFFFCEERRDYQEGLVESKIGSRSKPMIHSNDPYPSLLAGARRLVEIKKIYVV